MLAKWKKYLATDYLPTTHRRNEKSRNISPIFQKWKKKNLLNMLYNGDMQGQKALKCEQLE